MNDNEWICVKTGCPRTSPSSFAQNPDDHATKARGSGCKAPRWLGGAACSEISLKETPSLPSEQRCRRSKAVWLPSASFTIRECEQHTADNDKSAARRSVREKQSAALAAFFPHFGLEKEPRTERSLG